MRTTVFGLILCLLVTFVVPSHAEAATPKIGSKAGIVVDVTNGQILFAKNENDMLQPASITKVMTAFLVREAVETGKLSWNQQVIPSDKALQLANKPGLASIPLVKQPYTLKQLYDVALIRSANEAAVVLAETVSGSEKEFVRLMNAKAGELGMTQTTFANASGLNAELSGQKGENLTSADDLARLVITYMERYPDVIDVTRQGYTELNGVRIESTNRMLAGRDLAYKGMIGFKTGTTDEAGSCLVAVSARSGRTIVSVVLGAESDAARYEETKRLHNFAYEQFSVKTLLSDGERLPDSLYVAEGENEYVAVKAEDALEVLVRKGSDLPKLLVELDDQRAPLAEGETVGRATVENTKTTRYLEDFTPPAVRILAAEGTDRASWMIRLFRAIGDFMDRVESVLDN